MWLLQCVVGKCYSPPAPPVTMEAIPDGPVPLSPSMVIFDWLLIRCLSSAFSASSWSMSACRASIVSSNSLQQRGGQHHRAVDLKQNMTSCLNLSFLLLFLLQQSLGLVQSSLNLFNTLVCVFGRTVQLLLQQTEADVRLAQLLSLKTHIINMFLIVD